MARSGSKKKYKILSEPVSVVAHQLKNPISFLYGCLEVLLSEEMGKLNPKQKEYLNDAFENVRRIKETVNNFLDISKIEADKYDMKLRPTDLTEITQEIIASLFPLAKASNCEILFCKPKDIPLVNVDPFKIQQVIENFISNAIKYKSAGPGKVEVKIEKRGNKVVFICKDQGIGVVKKDLKKLFSKFYRSEEAMGMDPSGAGLGLYINKAIVELSGGKIWFRKNKGKGMTFYFSLPFAK